MRNINLIVPSTIVDHLAYLTGHATRGVRKVDNTLRIKLADRTVSATNTPQTAAAVIAIAVAGHRVRRFEGDSILEASVVATADGDHKLEWAERKSRFTRVGAVVEVTL